ncbi:MFS transporter [Aeromicrobium halocynthiae]|uniref:MFS transporter n=1 Tax=Aeromicrobium halocynthiae TaxID=560557 RepID=A0ABN2VYX0_9ACTN
MSTTTRTPAAEARATHPALVIVALALGGFSIGTTEFVTMGLLQEIADGIGETIPRTGHIISAYAFGVVVGAPLIVAACARLPRKALAVGLVVAIAVGNAATALADGYPQLMGARFLAGLPHGAYFGVASLLAASVVGPERRGRAVAGVMLGLSVATVAGVPASTWLGQNLGWRAAYWLVVVLAVLTVALVLAVVPSRPGNPDATVRAELGALARPQVLFAVAAGMIGFGGVFALYSYVSPLATNVTGVALSSVPWFLLAFGVGSVVGSWLAGMLSDWDVERTVLGGFAVLVAVLVASWWLTPTIVGALVTVFVVGVLGSVLAIGLQIRLMNEAGDAEMLGAALNHSSLNVANGLGAAVGSVVIAGGLGYRAPGVVGAGLAGLGLGIFAVALVVQRRGASRTPDVEDQTLTVSAPT